MTRQRRLEIKAKYRESHREKLRVANREYQARIRREQPDRARDADIAYKAKNRERLNEYERNRRKLDPEAAREACRRYRQKNLDQQRERARLYTKLHPEQNRAAARRRRALRHGATGSHTQAQLDALMLKQGGRCADCGDQFSPSTPPTVDHIVALSRGGSDSIENLRWTCRSCNSAKYNKSPLEWARIRALRERC